MVEHNLAMVRVASSNLVSRSIKIASGRVSKAVIQRIANSYSPVRLWNAPPRDNARVVKLVDTRDLKSLGPYPSVPVRPRPRAPLFKFASDAVNFKVYCPGGEIGRHKGLKIPRTLSVRAGSTPAPGTTF